MKDLLITLKISPFTVVLIAAYLLGFVFAFRFYLHRYEGRMKYYSREVFSEAVVFAFLWPVMVCVMMLWRGIDYIRESRESRESRKRRANYADHE